MYKMIQKPVEKLVPYAKNSRTHSEEQVQEIARSITEFGFTNPILVDENDSIIAGHGRVMAATSLGLKKLPCIVLDGLSDEQKRAYVIADNKLALNAGWDIEALKEELTELAELDFNMDLTGFSGSELTDLFTDEDEESGVNYSRKIESPIYEIKGDEPPVDTLLDETKTDILKSEIIEADIPEEIADFLLKAADRHTVFDFGQIAEYYAHASAEVQALMEKSALIIIDFDQAIEEGFVKLTGEMAAQYAKDHKDE